jgi:ankyrin repeat protein
MSRVNQLSTQLLVRRGGKVDALDTYGYTPLHRMASNNLAVGAEALLTAGADVHAVTSQGATPLSVAKESRSTDVIHVLLKHGAER